MARNIIVLESSSVMSRIIKSMLLANINDVIVEEVSDLEEAEARIAAGGIHVALMGWETVRDQWPRVSAWFSEQKEGYCRGAVLGSGSGREEVASLTPGFEFLEIPCDGREMAGLINRLCNPVSLRQSKRYNIPGTVVRIDQGRCEFSAAVINVSEGGMLCEFDFQEQFVWSDPVVATIEFPTIDGDDEILAAVGLTARLSLLKVMTRDQQERPQGLRASFVFSELPSVTRDLLRRVFALAEKKNIAIS